MHKTFMEKHILSKSTFIRGVQCVKSLYLNKKRPFLRDRLSDAQRAIFKRGIDVGVLAQQLFPGGINLKPRSPAQYRKKAAETLEAVSGNTCDVLYEATFQYDRLMAILDILVKSPGGWTAYEVKSSRKISETYLTDAAFQYYVIMHSGVPLEDFFLVTINPHYVMDNKLDISRLFTMQSVLEEVKSLQGFIEAQIEKEKKALSATSSPPVPIGIHCHHPYPCDFLGHCWKKVAENSLLYLDAFAAGERFEKYYAGLDAPEDTDPTLLSGLQKTQLLSARERQCVVNKEELGAFVNNHLEEPVFLSLFAIRPAVPCFEGTRPYDPLPVAALYRLGPGVEKVIFFIGEDNPAGAFVSFLTKMASRGNPIIMYDSTEALEIVKKQGTEKEKQLVAEHLFDLKTLFKNGILFHYLFRGDYTPEHISQVLLKQTERRLNPSLLGMHWQRRLFERNFLFEDLKNETEAHLYALSGFIFNLANFLKNKA